MKGETKMNFIRNLFKKDQPSEIKASSESPQVKELLLGLPVIKEENISNYRQTIISAESHPSMFVGSTNETAGFVAKMSEETERFILSSQGIARVEKRFLMNDYRVGEKILEIQYQQFWNNGTSSIYCEHVMRIGQDKFEVFGSISSASRMKAFRASSEESTDSPKSFTERDNNGEKPVVIGRWNFEDEESGQTYYIIFNRDGTLIHKSDFSDTETIGRWSQDGNSIHFEVGGYSVGDGKVVGKQMTGSSSNVRGLSWKWSAIFKP